MTDYVKRRWPLSNRRACETFELRHGNQNTVFSVTIGRYPNGDIGEIFVSGAKTGSDLDATIRDTAILASLALQHGASINTLASALTKEGDGTPSTVIGRVLDRLLKSDQP